MHNIKDRYEDPILDDMVSREVLIDNRDNSNELEDYQVDLSIDEKQLFFEAQDGLRFVDENLKIINYWNELFPSKEWIEVTKIPASVLTALRMLDGNPSASSASNIKTTYLVGDDFDDNTFDDAKWSRSTATYIKEQNQRMDLLYQDHIGTTHLLDQDADISNQGLVIEVDFNVPTIQSNSGLMLSLNNVANRQSDSGGGVMLYARHSSAAWLCYVNHINVYDGGTLTAGDHTCKIIFEHQTSTKFYVDGGLLVTDTTNSPDVTYDLMAWVRHWGDAHWIDDIRIRKYSSPEPTTQIGVMS